MSVKKLNKALSIISLIASGFFLYTVVFIAFIQVESLNIKLIMMGIFSIPVLLTLFLGLALRSFDRWERVCSVVIFSTASFCAFLFLSIICILYSPELKDVIDREAFTFFSDMLFGFGFFSFVLLLGTMLFFKSKS